MKNMFAPHERSSGRTTEIKAWVSKQLGLGENALVSVADSHVTNQIARWLKPS